jgi:hypothetical protein
MQITFSLNLNAGEADITRASEAKLIDLMYSDSLLAADVLKDMAGITSRLYGQALHLRRLEDEARISADG